MDEAHIIHNRIQKQGDVEHGLSIEVSLDFSKPIFGCNRVAFRVTFAVALLSVLGSYLLMHFPQYRVKLLRWFSGSCSKVGLDFSTTLI